jgi:hypothetical protein
MLPSDRELATEVLTLLQSAKLVRDDGALQKAMEISSISVPSFAADLTPRFEAYFAISVLMRAIRQQESHEAIARRFAQAVALANAWLQASV